MPVDTSAPELRDELTGQFEAELSEFFDLQRQAFATTGTYDAPMWRRRTSRLLFHHMKGTATAFGRLVSSQLRARRSLRFMPDLMDGWLSAVADHRAERVVGDTAAGLEDEDTDNDDVWVALAGAAALLARTLTTTAASFGAVEGARAGRASTKTWQVNSNNPRPEHARLDGETVDMDQDFSNGMAWPGDPDGGPENLSNCQCSVTFDRGE